jgi:hypothetical protein
LNSIYAYAVSYIAESIFPGDAARATLLAFMTFAVSFLVRLIRRPGVRAARRSHGRRQILAIIILFDVRRDRRHPWLLHRS